MIKLGVALLCVSSVSVLLRNFEIVYLSGPTVKFLCMGALSASVACFLATYCYTEYAHSHTPRPRR